LWRNRTRELVKGVDGLAINGHDTIAWLQLALCWLAGKYVSNHRGRELCRPQKHHEVQREREHEVHERARENDHDTLPERLRVEGCCFIGTLHFIVRVFAQHAHVATQRDRGDDVICSTARKAGDARTKPQAEREHPHTKQLGPQEVPRLMHKNEHAHQDDEVHDVHGTAAKVADDEQAGEQG
jgi:hypothetical protein